MAEKMYDFHSPVLLKESVAALNIQAGGIYVDLTFGGGGHSREILNVLKGGQLWAFDQDPASAAKAAAVQDERLYFVQGNFRFFTAFLHAHGIKQVSGILADLGVSSHQLDRPERGFAARLASGPLDMRMPQVGELTAAKILNSKTPEELYRLKRMKAPQLDLIPLKIHENRESEWNDWDFERNLDILERLAEKYPPSKARLN